MNKTKFSTVTLNNGYVMPACSACPDMPDSDDLELWQARNPGVVPFAKEVEELLALGYRSFDTGKRYGTEEILGSRFRVGDIPREELFMTTKVYHDGHGYDRTLRYVEEVLKKTGLAYIDLFLIHCPVTYRGLYAETFRALTEVYKAGLVRAVGVSNFTVQHFYDLEQVTDIVPAVNQREQNPFYVQHNLLAYERKHNITPQSYGPLGRGKYVNDPRLRPLAEKYGKSIAQIILRWHLQSGFMFITRTTSAARAAQNADIYDFSLAPEDMGYIAALNHGSRNWHEPIRFPGSYFYDPVERAFWDRVEALLAAVSPEKKAGVLAGIHSAMAYQDIDGTCDLIIACFTIAQACHGCREDLPQLAMEEARRMAERMVESLAKENAAGG